MFIETSLAAWVHPLYVRRVKPEAAIAAPSAPRTGRFGEPASYRVVRRGVIALVSLHAVLALWSGYRAIWQVWRLEVRISTPVVHAGSVVSVVALTSRRVPNPIVVELRQGARAETLIARRARQNDLAVYNPRFYHTRDSVTLTPAHLARFAPGPASLRITGMGVSQFLHVPPPVVRETTVTIAR